MNPYHGYTCTARARTRLPRVEELFFFSVTPGRTMVRAYHHRLFRAGAASNGMHGLLLRRAAVRPRFPLLPLARAPAKRRCGRDLKVRLVYSGAAPASVLSIPTRSTTWARDRCMKS